MSSGLLANPRLQEADETLVDEGRAAPLLRAIARYQQDHDGQSPEQIQSLVPFYMDEIPMTFGGVGFEYWPNRLGGYMLCFDLVTRRNCGCCYLQRHGIWDCSPGSE